jgi:SAM-dependent methyltransferase
MNLIKLVKSLWSQNPLVLGTFMRDWKSFVRVHFLYAAMGSGLLEFLKRPSSREDLMERLQVKRPELLDALLDLGIALREVSYKNGLYQVKGKRSRALIGDKRDMYKGLVEAQVTYYNSVYRYAPERLWGRPLGNYLEEIGDIVARYSELVEPYIRWFLEDRVARRGRMRILDVGCGSGIYLRAAAEANPEARGIGLELDNKVLEQARQNLNKWGIGDRFEVVAGDIRVSPPHLIGEFNLIGLYNVIYYFTVEERLTLFQRLQSMLLSGGAVAIVTTVQAKGKDIGSANLNLATSSMVGCTSLPDLREIIDQLKASGYHQITATKLIPRSAIYGIVAM